MKVESLFKLAAFFAVALFIGNMIPGPAESSLSNPVGSDTNPAINAEYIMVKNDDALAHEVGDVLVYKDDTNDGIDVSSTTTNNSTLVAGVVAIADIPASGSGLLQVSGYHSAVTVSVATTAGDPLTTSTTGESADVLTLAESTSTAAAHHSVFGVAFETTTTSTTVKALIRLQ